MAEYATVKIKELRCPKCGARPNRLTEVLTGFTTTFECHEDGTRDLDGFHSEGDPFKVLATCSSCKHHWRLRGVRQITNLDLS